MVNASDSGSRGRGFEPPSGQTVLCHIYSPKVLVIRRKRWLRPNMTEKLFTGTLRINQPTNLLPSFVTIQHCSCWSTPSPPPPAKVFFHDASHLKVVFAKKHSSNNWNDQDKKTRNKFNLYNMGNSLFVDFVDCMIGETDKQYHGYILLNAQPQDNLCHIYIFQWWNLASSENYMRALSIKDHNTISK